MLRGEGERGWAKKRGGIKGDIPVLFRGSVSLYNHSEFGSSPVLPVFCVQECPPV